MKRLFSVMLLTCLCATSVMAQPPRGQGGPGGRGGPGGGATAILAIPEVQKELDLKDEQTKQLTALMEKTREEMRGSFADLRDLKDDERQKKMAELRAKGEETQKKTMDQVKTILDATQYERFQQLRLQREGAMALSQPDVAEKLKLSTEQQEKISKLVADSRTNAGGFQRGGGAPSEEDRKKMQEAREKSTSDLLAVLTSEQKASFETLQGKKFEFPRGGTGGRPRAN